MKVIHALTLGVLFTLMLPVIALADSPVTSTPFYEAYSDIGAVARAHEGGVMTLSIAKLLSSSHHTIDVKMAVINALSWDIDGKSNGELYSYFLALKYGLPLDELDFATLTSDEQLCLGYLYILDDYFHPDRGITLLEMANERVEDSFTYSIILAIGRAQEAMDYDWDEVWKLAERVFGNKKLKQDMREDAVNIIRDYMVLYKE